MHNAIADLLSKSETSSGFGIENNRDPTTLLIRNDTGAELPQFGIVGIGSPLVSPSDNLTAFMNRLAFAGLSPVQSTYRYKFGVTLGPIAMGATGLVRVSGLTHCWINGSTTPSFAGPASPTNVNYLVSASCGARVIYRTSGTGTQRAIVIL